MPTSPCRLAVVLSHPTQYYSPWFRWIQAQQCVCLRVYFLWDFGVAVRRDRDFGKTFAWDIDLLSGFESEFVPNIARDPGTHHFGGLHNPELCRRLSTWNPDAVLLFGYKYRTHLSLLLRPPAPLIFRGDSHFLGRQPPVGLKGLALSWVYRRFAAITYVGQANRAYFRTLGVPESRLHFAPHCVDAARFAPSPAVRMAAQELRGQLGLHGKKVVLFAGKLIPAKNPRGLLEAFLKNTPADAALVFVGDGVELPTLRERAAGAPVHFLPFANQSEMPARYALADLFVLPSVGLHETWGLAVNEAMHLGVPCLVSDRVGCQQDLVTEGETGWVFPAANPSALTVALARALAGVAGDTSALQTRIAARMEGYTYAQATAGLLAALTAVTR